MHICDHVRFKESLRRMSTGKPPSPSPSFHHSSVFCRVQRDSTQSFARPSVPILFFRLELNAGCSCPNASVTFSITAPAISHATKAAVYSALFSYNPIF